MNYEEFIASKSKQQIITGFDYPEAKLNKKLFDFQKHCTSKAIKHGRYALFEECGLGKTFQQVEFARVMTQHTKGKAIIFCPLAVAGQTIEVGERLNIEIGRYPSTAAINIVNYDQIDNVVASNFETVILDESSILKNVDGKTKSKLIESFDRTPFKLCCTATPSPNDDMEICNHAELLNQGRRDEILAMYFTHDGGDTSKWTLKGHAKKDFWRWVKTWAMFLSNPADLGFDGRKYVLPKLNILERIVEVPVKDGMLFNSTSVSATDFNAELRDTMEYRLDDVAKLARKSKENFIIWVKLDSEADYIMNKIKGAVEVRGSDPREEKEEKLLAFSKDKFRVLITKTKIAQFGLNFQNCNNQCFPSLDFSFEGTYQGIRRSYRFGQKKEVNIHLTVLDTMKNVIQSIRAKEKQFEAMKTFLKNV